MTLLLAFLCLCFFPEFDFLLSCLVKQPSVAGTKVNLALLN